MFGGRSLSPPSSLTGWTGVKQWRGLNQRSSFATALHSSTMLRQSEHSLRQNSAFSQELSTNSSLQRSVWLGPKSLPLYIQHLRDAFHGTSNMVTSTKLWWCVLSSYKIFTRFPFHTDKEKAMNSTGCSKPSTACGQNYLLASCYNHLYSSMFLSVAFKNTQSRPKDLK